MKSHIPVEKYLETIREFQKEFPNAHVGGSIGLLLHGIDLKRHLTQSDIDMTLDEDIPKDKRIKDFDEASNAQDFDRCFRKDLKDNRYIKIDLRINPEPSFEIIPYRGEYYNVSKKRDILFWKDKYAKKGVQKHIDDMIVINGGERPQPKVWVPTPDDDDLPF